MNNPNRSPLILLSFVICLGTGVFLGATENDAQIESAIKNSYNFTHYLKDDDISVQSANGVVTLKGTVAQDYHRLLAKNTASGTPGVARVETELAVKANQPKERSDAWITLMVKGSLAIHRTVSALATQVSTDHGVVTLSGRADSEDEKDLASRSAKDIEGVTAVHNDMVVAGGDTSSAGHAVDRVVEHIDDASITAQLEISLWFHYSTHALKDIHVTTSLGVVTINGDCKTLAEKILVSKLASDIGGVKKVDNQMRIMNVE